MNSSFQQKVADILSLADVTLNGTRPWDIHVNRDSFYSRVMSQGSLGLGESYMDGDWDCDQIDELIAHILAAHLDKKVSKLGAMWPFAQAVLFNMQNKSRAFEVGERHYDIGNDLYQIMLDKRLTYTCGYWKNATNLEQAQEAKLELVCQKIGLKKGMSVLDIGCGWGSFMIYAAQKYGARVTGVTVSKEQMELGKKMAGSLPIEFQLKDYRDIIGTYDRVVSLGMIEHVGYKNYHTFMDVASRSLADDGLFLLHTIGNNKSEKNTDAWIDRYIFPNSMLPSISQLARASEDFFVMEDWHNFGADYEKTLLAWFENFNRGWKTLKDKKPQYNDRFYRMWKYYLLSCAGTFRIRRIQLWQIVLSKQGIPGGYTSVR